jgi:peptidoglycan/xylan/chitin deacetylase (PgdA/CDA1 family)
LSTASISRAGRARRSLLRISPVIIAATVLAAPALADCPGNPGALGTSRTLVVDPMEHPRIGTMQYAETLPLRDHEVVLTFDDGPLPPHSDQVLQILASECVKATFFIIGRMAHQFPEGVRKVRAAGHTIGTHSENHPLSFSKMPPERIRQEIDLGIAHTIEALGDASAVAPFFRVPGLRRGQVMEEYLVSKGIQSWSADFPADDWRHISADQVYHYAISRIEAKRRGILLLHDIQARTVAALPRILQTLKARGYKIVHVVPAMPGLPKTPTQPWQWLLHPPAQTVAISHWPAVPRFLFVSTGTLPAPQFTTSDLYDGRLVLPPRSRRLVLGPAGSRPHALWPHRIAIRTAPRAPALPVPEQAIFTQPERAVAQAFGLAPLPQQSRLVHPTLDDSSIGQMISTDIGRPDNTAPPPPIPGSAPIAGPDLRPAPPAPN